MKEKILTQEIVRETGLDKVSVITTDMLDGYTSIGDMAFYYCCGLTSIEIPNSVTSIGNYAFEGCPGLTSPVYNAHVFAYMPTYYSGAYTIPDGIESIAGGAFLNCTGLTSVTIPNSVTSIGAGAFIGCSSLSSIIIPNSVTIIGDYAFQGCTGLSSVTIANSVTSIGEWAFLDCNNLTSVTIGDKKYKTQEVKDGKCKAYKAFNANLTCREFQYEEGKTYEFNGEPKLCEKGFHACLNLLDVFNYYNGEFGKDIVVHEVELEGVSDERKYDSKVVAKKITIGKRIL